MRITTLFRSLAVLFAFTAAGCQDAAEDGPVALKSVNAAKYGVDAVKYVHGMKLVVIDGQEWLGVGGPPIPPGVPIPAPPEPYNLLKHGPPLKNSMPNANLVLRADFQPPPKDHHFSKGVRTDDPKTVQAERGMASWFIVGGPTHGMISYPEVTINFPINPFYPNAHIYTSTELPYGHACIEMVVIHRQGQLHQQGYYNHCATPEHWISIENMTNSAWLDRHARRWLSTDNELHIYQEVYRDPVTGCWQGLLFNFNDMEMEAKTPLICGTGHSEAGWTGWESWNFMEQMDSSADCPNLLSVSNTLGALDPKGPYNYFTPFQELPRQPSERGVCFREDYYDLRETSQVSEWTAETPLPDPI